MVLIHEEVVSCQSWGGIPNSSVKRDPRFHEDYVCWLTLLCVKKRKKKKEKKQVESVKCSIDT